MKTISRSRNDWAPQQGSKAVIYTRVSSAAQVKKGRRARLSGDQVPPARPEQGLRGGQRVSGRRGSSGGMVDRPGMHGDAEISESAKGKSSMLILIDDISRLARVA
jgi:hypothetical protein